jgi:CHAT domain-containing protein
MILNSVTAIQQSIMQSNDTSLISSYELLRSLNQQISFWQQKPISERKVDLSGLENQANELEKNLTHQSRDFALMQQQFSITWQDVQKSLTPGETAIEFINFDYYNGKRWTDSTLYCALVLRKEYQFPKMVFLFEEKQLDSLLTKCKSPDDNTFVVQLYNRSTKVLQSSFHAYGAELYQLIWSPIDSLLSGIRTIFFAPSGKLHQVAFAAIPYGENRLLMDKYNLVQFSSTREIALGRKDELILSPDYTTVLYGGIQYLSDTTQMIEEALAYNRSTGVSRITSINLQDTLPPFLPLPGTENEIKEINTLLKDRQKSCITFTGTKASEESFRALSGNTSPGILHIATHGFFFADPPEKPKERMDFMLTGQQKFTQSDDPLLRSGLIFAGANHYWMGEKLPAGVQDGLVTAKDVSTMNLTNTKLVVMSACETGLGYIEGSEGVFGLQRGFKMAGVNALIMSLWQVPDAETAQFMEMFYSGWLSGKTLRQAFLDTQHAMKDSYPDDPYKWAAFVMVE